MKKTEDFIPGEKFHSEVKKVYTGKYHWAVNKKHSEMARVLYEPAHENNRFDDERRGSGKDFATWVFSEERDTRENIFTTGLELFIDATLEPQAAIGLHTHDETEEIYYILAGSIKMTTIGVDGQQHSEELTAGDAHMIKKGQAHYGTAGAQGVRFITVALRG
jgi:quercetin dioxygenase-like cupin family protein